MNKEDHWDKAGLADPGEVDGLTDVEVRDVSGQEGYAMLTISGTYKGVKGGLDVALWELPLPLRAMIASSLIGKLVSQIEPEPEPGDSLGLETVILTNDKEKAAMSPIIKPTVGRVVLYRPQPGEGIAFGSSGTVPAIVCNVWNDRCINIAGFDANGRHFARSSVTLVQEGDQPVTSAHCTWMDYQKGQAAKTEALEAQLAAKLQEGN